MPQVTNYEIVKPYFELFEPCITKDYMEFLERCVRTCYKSEEHIKIGSAEKLLKKVVNDFGHYSVVEHANCIIQISDPWVAEDMFQDFVLTNPLLRLSFRDKDRETLLVSGNIRMWTEFIQNWPPLGKIKCFAGHGIDSCLDIQYPFFFTSDKRAHAQIKLVDFNPVTNRDNLSQSEMLQHMTMTGRFVGSRSMSHQLVRHRLAAYSQESQRYCNYDKKGLQVILPKSINEWGRTDGNGGFAAWHRSVQEAYRNYLYLLDCGIPPEDARSVLPNATKTEVVATYTLGIWKHIFKHRAYNPKAQWEIKDLCLSAEEQIKKKLPGVL